MNEEEKKAIHKEYELGRAQAEYEVNEYWKSLIKEKIEELKKCGNDWIIQREIQVLKELLEKVDD